MYDSHDLQISDGRGRESEFSLDKHGFAFAEIPPGATALQSRTAIETEYLSNMESFLKEYLDAEKVQAFDYVVSSSILTVDITRVGRCSSKMGPSLISGITSSVK